MELSIEATYEGGVLKPAEPLPLAEHEKVRVKVQPVAKTLERLATDPEFDPQEDV
jgi:predicted DNA-binding antitoxin AbrB/MazE fold protein